MPKKENPNIKPDLQATIERLWGMQSDAELRRLKRRRTETIAQVVIGILMIVIPVVAVWATWPELARTYASARLSTGEIIEIRRMSR
jgi:hypothetical protein